MSCPKLSVKDKLLRKNRALMQRNVKKLDAFFADYPELFEWQHPDGSCIGFPRFTGRGGVETFCQKLVEEEGVLLLPASIYESELMQAPKDRFRIGFGRDNIDDGLAAFRKYMNRQHNALKS